MKLVCCILVCAFLKVVYCLQQATPLDDNSYGDVQGVPLSYLSAEDNYLRILAQTERNIVQCLFCNFILSNKYLIGRNYFNKDRLLQCAYYSTERCLSYFENYLNVNGADNVNKHKRHFDEIDKTGPGFNDMNQLRF